MKIRSDQGFTLIELLVVISIIALLSSVILAAVSNVRSQSSVAAGEEFSAYNYHTFGTDEYVAWDMDEGSGSIAADVSGNNNTLNLTGSPLWVSSINTYNKRGSAITLNGSSQYGTASKTIIFPITNNSTNITLGAWIQTASANSGGGIVISISASNLFGICVDNGYLDVPINVLGVGNSDYCDGKYKTTSYLSDGKWHYIAMSISTSKTITLYVDGKLINPGTPFTGTLNLSPGNLGSPVTINVGQRGGGLNYFNGNIDEVHIYYDALTAFDIENIYAEGLARHNLAIR